jgi:hypothetical protein
MKHWRDRKTLKGKTHKVNVPLPATRIQVSWQAGQAHPIAGFFPRSEIRPTTMVEYQLAERSTTETRNWSEWLSGTHRLALVRIEPPVAYDHVQPNQATRTQFASSVLAIVPAVQESIHAQRGE